MARYLAGVGSALLLVAAGFLIWNGRAERQSPVPNAPREASAAVAADGEEEPSAGPPSAPDKTREEKRFARYDKNEDGIITRGEMMDTRRKPFAKLDGNGDGRLSFEEWAVATASKFATADADHSGTLTRAEFATTRRETHPQKCAC